MGFAGLAVGAALAGLRPVYGYLSRVESRMADPQPQLRIYDMELRHAG